MPQTLESHVFIAAAGSLPSLLPGILLGLGAAMPIGPVNVQIARRALRRGFGAGAAVGLGAVSVDVLYLLLSTLSFARLLNRPAIILPISALGVLLLAWLGVLSLTAAREALRTDPLKADAGAAEGSAAVSTFKEGYATGVLMTLLNPITLAFWFTVVPVTGVLSASGAATTSDATHTAAVGAGTANLPMLAGGVLIGTLAWVVGFCALLSLVRRASRQRPAARRWSLAIADATGGLVLLTFSVLGASAFLREVWRHL